MTIHHNKRDTQQKITYFSAPNLENAIMDTLNSWANDEKVQRLWANDTSLWTHSNEDQWTGWLYVGKQHVEVARIETLREEIKRAQYTDIVVLGMGGSSLTTALLAETFGKIKGYPRLHILDSTSPQQILHLEESIELTKTLFIVSSKSGSTLEPNILKDYFFSKVQIKLDKKEVGEHFIAITDRGTSLEKIAQEQQFKAIFYGVSKDGGRYSGLSHFGMVPSGLAGIDIGTFLHHAKEMQNNCLPSVAILENPGVVLGVILGVCALANKNKITLVLSPRIRALGAWIEQLLAESTGKNGKGLIPIDLEPLGTPHMYGNDRVFVYIRLHNDLNTTQDEAMHVLELAGFVVVKLQMHDIMHLGAELFRWEFATAVAGSIIGIDPFNQPDVEASKTLTLQLTAQYEKKGSIETLQPLLSENGISLFADKKNAAILNKKLKNQPSMIGYLSAHFNQIQKNDYVDLSAFIEMSQEYEQFLEQIRLLIRDKKKIATCAGFGPRFLHSTGQAYKGGPNTGVFLQITAEVEKDIEVPTHKYSFGLVIAAQAQADFKVLAERQRRIIRIHLGSDVGHGLEQLKGMIASALTPR